LCFILASTTSRAQGNLQFNQVITYTGSIQWSTAQAGQPFFVNGPQWTVPSGKVWKVEHKKKTPFQNLGFYLNGISVVDIFRSSNVYGYSGVSIDNSILWLKENDIINFAATAGNGENNGTGGTVEYVISILEFNVIP
jgi:hypothetical protein